MIEFKTIEAVDLDWTTLKIKNVPVNTVVILDHFTIEAGLAKAIHEIHRFDL